MSDLFNAWSENMNNLTKRKKSEKHWQAGLKKWLDGQWRKDKKSFDLTLKEPKYVEANQIRILISQLFQIQEDIKICVKKPAVTHHHHHYYCKCGSPSVAQMDQLNLQLLTQGNSGEVHQHYIHYVEDNNLSCTLEEPSKEPSKELVNIDCNSTKSKGNDPMDDETEYDEFNAISGYDTYETDQEEYTNEKEPIENHEQTEHTEYTENIEQSEQHQNTFHIEWPWQDITVPDFQWPEVQWPPQVQWPPPFEVNLPQWPPQFEVNLPQWPQITNSISNIFKKDNKKN